MTRQDREAAIADNIEYVNRAVGHGDRSDAGALARISGFLARRVDGRARGRAGSSAARTGLICSAATFPPT